MLSSMNIRGTCMASLLCGRPDAASSGHVARKPWCTQTMSREKAAQSAMRAEATTMKFWIFPKKVKSSMPLH